MNDHTTTPEQIVARYSLKTITVSNPDMVADLDQWLSATGRYAKALSNVTSEMTAIAVCFTATQGADTTKVIQTVSDRLLSHINMLSRETVVYLQNSWAAIHEDVLTEMLETARALYLEAQTL